MVSSLNFGNEAPWSRTNEKFGLFRIHEMPHFLYFACIYLLTSCIANARYASPRPLWRDLHCRVGGPDLLRYDAYCAPTGFSTCYFPSTIIVFATNKNHHYYYSREKNTIFNKIVRKPRCYYQTLLIWTTENERERNAQPTSNTAIQRRLRRSGLYHARRPRLASFGNLEYSRTSSAA